MSTDLATWAHLEEAHLATRVASLAVLVVARLVSFLLRGLLRRTAESVSPRQRLPILRTIPSPVS